MSANLENSAVATGLEKVSFHSKPKEKQCQRMLKCTISLIPHASKVILKILQARIQQHLNHEFQDLEKGEEPELKLPTSSQSSTKQESSRNIYFCFIDYAKDFDCVDHNKLWKFPKELRIPDHLTYLLRKLYAGQEATVRNRYETLDWFQMGKGICQGCI